MYGSQADMEDRFGTEELIQLTDRTGSGVIDAAVLNRAIADADAEIDGYLASRYKLPLAETPPALTRIACDIARYLLYDDAVIDSVKDRYDNAVKFLRGVARGDVSLVEQTGDTAETAGVAEFESGRTVFNSGGGF
jgi:phage gp36-like protein